MKAAVIVLTLLVVGLGTALGIVLTHKSGMSCAEWDQLALRRAEAMSIPGSDIQGMVAIEQRSGLSFGALGVPNSYIRRPMGC